MQTKIESIKQRYHELESQLADPSLLSDPKKMRAVNEAFAGTSLIMEIIKRHEKTQSDLQGAKETLEQADEEALKELAQAEIDLSEAQLPNIEKELMLALVPPDPMDKKNIIVEIRAGAGGDESALFATELLRAYTMYGERRGWKTELVSANRNDLGGFKEVVCSISGQNVYSRLKYESGVHRVQRVPETEKQGRVHTSTVTVAILPEAEEVDVHIEPKDLVIETTTSQGAGGQSVNTTYSAVRITHIPTGTVVYCQEERSQKQNKERALSIIRARVYAKEQERLHKEREEARRGQIGTGDRSEKIRTYNFPQDRVTDHRIKESFHNITSLMDGNLDEIIDTLKQAEVSEELEA
ncbi:peptide chain release factor 1 [Candidatus Uhrbacteria bacterium]|nr:peptide chain release factor 1 [Candidatus Uhrbacteria bacterium]